MSGPLAPLTNLVNAQQLLRKVNEKLLGISSEFPLPKIQSQGEWLNVIKTGACQSCHALGTPGTRTISPALGVFANSAEAWQRRLRSGQASALMARLAGQAIGRRGVYRQSCGGTRG